MNENLLSRIFRILGALSLLVSSSTFLLTSWSEGSDLVRYAILLAHSILLFVGAFVSGKVLSEHKTARTLLWTATALIPFQLAALGGLIYSQFAFDPSHANLPQVATWVAGSPLFVLVAVGISIPIFALLARSSARVLSRGLARIWSRAFVAQSMLFLVPVRQPSWTAILVLLGVLVPMLADARWFSHTRAASVLEGRLLRGLLWASPVMIALRTMIFYSPDALFAGTLLSCVGASVLWLLRRVEQVPRALAVLAEVLSAVFLMVGAALLGSSFLPQVLMDDIRLAFVPVWSGVALSLCSRWARHCQALFWRVASFGSALVGTAVVLASTSIFVSALYLIFLTTLGVCTFLRRQPVPSVALGGAVLASIFALLRNAVGFEDVHLWQILSSLGLLSFALATLFEKKRGVLLVWMRSDRSRPEPAHQIDREPGDGAPHSAPGQTDLERIPVS